MRNKTTLIIFIFIFIALIGGASLLYNTLKDDLSSSNLTAFEEEKSPEESTALENKVEVEPEDVVITDNTPNDKAEVNKPQVPEKSEGLKKEESEKEEPKKEESEKSEEIKEEEKDSQNDGKIKNPAPDFTVYNKDEKAVKLSDFFGKPIVLNFWASWCGPCQSEMPDFEEKFLNLGSEINFLMINLTDGARETVSLADEFIRKKGYTFPIYYDKDIDAANKYRVYSIPTTYFIDKYGNLVAQASGAIDASTLQKGIDMIK